MNGDGLFAIPGPDLEMRYRPPNSRIEVGDRAVYCNDGIYRGYTACTISFNSKEAAFRAGLDGQPEKFSSPLCNFE